MKISGGQSRMTGRHRTYTISGGQSRMTGRHLTYYNTIVTHYHTYEYKIKPCSLLTNISAYCAQNLFKKKNLRSFSIVLPAINKVQLLNKITPNPRH